MPGIGLCSLLTMSDELVDLEQAGRRDGRGRAHDDEQRADVARKSRRRPGRGGFLSSSRGPSRVRQGTGLSRGALTPRVSGIAAIAEHLAVGERALRVLDTQ